jgi:hypothetical protein
MHYGPYNSPNSQRPNKLGGILLIVIGIVLVAFNINILIRMLGALLGLLLLHKGFTLLGKPVTHYVIKSHLWRRYNE